MKPEPGAHLTLVANSPGAAVLHVVATRADAVALAPVFSAIQRAGGVDQVVVDASFGAERPPLCALLGELGVPAPVASPALDDEPAAHVRVTATTVGALEVAETILSDSDPLAVVVSGASDVAMAWGLAATKLQIPVARIEAGLRAFDWADPEEVNRALTDTLADTLFAPTADAVANLTREGVAASRVHLVGSTTVDSMRLMLAPALARCAWRARGLERGAYVLVTLRRTANVEDDERLARIVEALADLAREVPVVLPLMPQQREQLELMGDVHRLVAAGVRCEPPVSYLESLSLQSGAGAVVTDSGTMQDETTALGIPCFTLGGVTERSVTLTHGTNALLGSDPRDIVDVVRVRREPTPCAIPLWDGRAGARVAQVLLSAYAFARVPRAS